MILGRQLKVDRLTNQEIYLQATIMSQIKMRIKIDLTGSDRHQIKTEMNLTIKDPLKVAITDLQIVKILIDQ